MNSNKLQLEIDKKLGESFENQRPLVAQLGNYFLHSLPSDLDQQLIQSVEVYLNQMSTQALSEGWEEDLQDAVLEALELSSSLSGVIKGHPLWARPPGKSAIKAKQLGRVLLTISDLF